MYKFSDLILSEDTPVEEEENPGRKTAVKPAERRVEYSAEVAEPDIVITKKTVKEDGAETINGQLVLLVTQGQFYIQNIARGKKQDPVILSEDNRDEFAAKVSQFFSKLPKPEYGPKVLNIDSKWLPKLKVDKQGFKHLIRYLLDPFYRELITKGYLATLNLCDTCTSCIWTRNDFSDRLMFVLDECSKVLGREAVCRAVTNVHFYRDVSMEDAQIAIIFSMCRRHSCTTDYANMSVIDEMEKRFGLSGIRDFVDAFVSVTNPYSNERYNAYTIIDTDFFFTTDEDGKPAAREYSLKKLTEYLTYAPIRQGFGSFNSFLNIWTDALMMQEQLYGKIKDKYPENLYSLHTLLSAKKRVIEMNVNEEKFAAHADKEKELRYAPEGEKFFITSPESKADMIDEATQQSNCLSGYVRPFANNITDIYFMRLKNKPEKSLVTIEVKNGRIRQALGARNSVISREESDFLAKWCSRFGIEYTRGEESRALIAPTA